MKEIILFLCFGMLLSADDTAAQQFINGSFEPAGSITPCVDNPVATYNSNMGGNWAVGSAANMQIANASCSTGSAVDGSYFGVVKYDVPSGNKIIFKLDKAMKAGTAYSFTINYKVPVGIPPAISSLYFGYGKDSVSSDSLSGYTDPITTETWIKDTFSFTPQNAWQYVWIELSALGGDPYTVHVDDLKMLNVPEGIEEVENGNGFTIWPNPGNGVATLTMDASITLPCRVEVYDVTGRVLLTQDHLRDRKASINITGASSGMFFVKLTDGRQQVHTSKLLVQ